ncbi:hypothetical protein NYO91_17440 [Arhodomonas aquaeolei]|uniref:hypothetical protein n=1 Tax=Arhodomonas aquaeolei TaxID=2369 RepID=UPI00216AA318|nr:hypothetical protein [Arhodomonas aquaeolei]MCS4505868.1 hypothetical protein [Arhodomonas aquaeolei]
MRTRFPHGGLRIVFSLFLCVFAAAGAAAPDRGAGQAASDGDPATPAWTRFLYEGDLPGARETLRDRLEARPGDDQARVGLAVTQLLGALERAAQGSYRYGLRPDSEVARFLPMGRMGTLANPDPETVAYTDIQAGLKAWVDDLARVEATLAKVEDETVKLPLYPGRIRLDFNGDGQATEAESLWRAYAAGAPFGLPGSRSPRLGEQAQDFRVVFDMADVHWLRGYTHLLMGTSDILLAHDWEPLFDRAGHLLFARPETDYPFLLEDGYARGMPWRFVDAIAFIHLINFEVTAPERMRRAHDHFQAAIRQSRESWDAIMAETDDDREWIPAPSQTGVVPGIAVTPEMIREWRRFLTEADALLSGEKLAPFWRGSTARGINVRRLFTEPHRFDLVLWLQGTGVAPYLETGDVTDPATWRQFQRTFRGRFLSFALWFN